MTKPKSKKKWGVIVFPGSNCDRDCYDVLKDVFDQDVEMIWHKSHDSNDTPIKDFDIIVLPGGFSYGDYLRCGAMAKVSPVMKEVIEFANNGGLVLGICNGFQVLVESGLLPGALMRNANLKFVCETVRIKVENANNPFTSKYKSGEEIKIPVAHMEGCYFIDDKGLKALEDNNQIVFRYVDNPNGSLKDIAGITNKRGNVLGLMPHPERISESLLGGEDGKRLFESAIAHFHR